ncbi:MAG TPA: ribonuclease P protein component [Candidatus Paceibacterota bacterium]|nr:ribonuclease P protein component [Candidatus Paceibacterota bacterium]
MALSRIHRLAKKRDFDGVFQSGTLIRGSWFSLRAFKRADSPGRVGFMVPSRVIPRAVDRTRIRRVLSEAVLALGVARLKGYDLVISISRSVPADFKRIQSDIAAAAAKTL